MKKYLTKDTTFNIDKVISYTVLIFTIISLCIKFIFLDRGLIFSDEGWYLCLLRDLPHLGGTNYHMLFKNVFQNNIYSIRICSYLLTILSTIILSIGFWIYCKTFISKVSLCICVGFVF